MVGSVKVSFGSVRRAWAQSGYGEFWLQLRTKDGSDDAFGQVIQDSNDAEEESEGAFGQLGTQSPQGYVTMVDRIRDAEHLRRWLDDLARRFEHAGFSGTLQGATPAHRPGWVASSHSDFEGEDIWWEPTAFIAWTFDLAMTADPSRRSNWHVPADATARICDLAVSWAQSGGPSMVLTRSTFSFGVLDRSTAPDILASAVSGTGMAEVFCFVDAERRGRRAALTPGGQGICQVVRGPDAWPDRMKALRSLILALPELADQAFIRPAIRTTFGWGGIDNPQPLPGTSEVDIRYNKHLLRDYVPDAHGIQVVNDAHLERAHDLDDWTVTDLGHGRHLVEARDLAPWYGQPLPDPDVVAEARHDFGPMILTKQVIDDNPPPWK